MVTPPECAHCPPGTPSTTQRDMGTRIRAGVVQRIYAWLCGPCDAAEDREWARELEWKRSG